VDNLKMEKYIGRTFDNKLVLFKGDRGLVGEEVKVKILKVTAHSLLGIISSRLKDNSSKENKL